MIDQATIDRILDAAQIEGVVSDFVTLRRRGVNLVGLCPFHEDKTPSFYVSPAKNICKCFACGEGGTAVHFIMKHEQLTYFDALRYLAKKYHIEIQERELTNEEKQVRNDRESMLIVNSWAQTYFTTQLFENQEGRIALRYFKERGFRDDIIKKFCLGYSLEQRDALYQEAIKSGYKKEFLEKTGLVISYEDGRANDRFRGRVIFPVHSLSGKVVAFGGRVLKKDEKTAKYINSPESEIYHKTNELYGIFFAKQSIIKADRCFLVEGYTDVISMHQAGIENVVASSGTALTMPQIRLIHRFTENITVLYDGDAAGIKAALRGIDLLLEEGMNIKVLLLPDGEDPDSFARKHNATQFSSFIAENETDFIRFKTKLLLDEAGSDPIKRAALISDIVRSVAIIPDNIARSVYIRECSSMMEIDERIILNEVNKIRLNKLEKQPSLSPQPPLPKRGGDDDSAPSSLVEGEVSPPSLGERGQGGEVSPFEALEAELIRYVVRYGEQILYEYTDEETNETISVCVAEYVFSELEQDDMHLFTPIYKRMLAEVVEHCKEEGFTASRFFLHHPDSGISKIGADQISDKYQLSKYHSKYREIKQEKDQLDQFVPMTLVSFKEAYIRHKINEFDMKMKELQTKGEVDEAIALMREKETLDTIKKALNVRIGERIILKM